MSQISAMTESGGASQPSRASSVVLPFSVSSLPRELQLVLSPKSDSQWERSIVARSRIKENVVYGPLVAPSRRVTLDAPPASVLSVITLIVPATEPNQPLPSYATMDAYVLDSDSECNWMKFARFSLNGKANLEIVQKDNLLYFVSTNPIEEGEELLVGLSLQRSLTLETFFDSLWNNWAQTLPDAERTTVKNCFGDLQQGLFVRRIREVLRQNNVQNLDVLRERVLRIDWTGARFLQSLMVVTDDPATWLPLNVYVRRIFRRLAKWVSLPSAVRRTVLETNLADTMPSAISLVDSGKVFILSPLTMTLRDDDPLLHFNVVPQPNIAAWLEDAPRQNAKIQNRFRNPQQCPAEACDYTTSWRKNMKQHISQYHEDLLPEWWTSHSETSGTPSVKPGAMPLFSAESAPPPQIPSRIRIEPLPRPFSSGKSVRLPPPPRPLSKKMLEAFRRLHPHPLDLAVKGLRESLIAKNNSQPSTSKGPQSTTDTGAEFDAALAAEDQTGPLSVSFQGYMERCEENCPDTSSEDPVEREGLRTAWLTEHKKSFAEAWLKYKDDVLISSHNATTSQEEEDEGLFGTDEFPLEHSVKEGAKSNEAASSSGGNTGDINDKIGSVFAMQMHGGSDGNALVFEEVEETGPSPITSANQSEKFWPPNIHHQRAAPSQAPHSRLSTIQRHVLEGLFADCPLPKVAHRELLAGQLGLTGRVVEKWFGNARQRAKRQSKLTTKSVVTSSGVTISTVDHRCTICHIALDPRTALVDHLFTDGHIDRLKQRQSRESTVGEVSESSIPKSTNDVSGIKIIPLPRPRGRTTFSESQRRVLEGLLADCPMPSLEHRLLLAQEMSLLEPKVKKWFLNAPYRNGGVCRAAPSLTTKGCALCGVVLGDPYVAVDHLFSRDHMDRLRGEAEDGVDRVEPSGAPQMASVSSRRGKRVRPPTTTLSAMDAKRVRATPEEHDEDVYEDDHVLMTMADVMGGGEDVQPGVELQEMESVEVEEEISERETRRLRREQEKEVKRLQREANLRRKVIGNGSIFLSVEGSSDAVDKFEWRRKVYQPRILRQRGASRTAKFSMIQPPPASPSSTKRRGRKKASSTAAATAAITVDSLAAAVTDESGEPVVLVGEFGPIVYDSGAIVVDNPVAPSEERDEENNTGRGESSDDDEGDAGSSEESEWGEDTKKRRKRGRPAKKVMKPAKRKPDRRKGKRGKVRRSARTDTVDAPFESFRRKGNPPGIAYTPLVVTFGYENLRQEGKRWHCECRFCGITKSEGAGWHSGFRQHLKTHHRQIYDMYRENPHQPPPPADPYLPRPFACADCDAKWPTKKLLFLHIKGAHDKRRRKCFTCLQSFTPRSVFMDHLNTHRNEEGQMACRFCDFNHIRHRDLVRHYRADHRHDPRYHSKKDRRVRGSTRPVDHEVEARLKCAFCGQGFAAEEGVRLHMREVHPEEYQKPASAAAPLPPGVTLEPNQCDICFRIFKLPRSLLTHKKANHSGFVGLKCAICDEGFTDRKLYSPHMETHRVDGKLLCPKCAKPFATIRDFATHFRMHSHTIRKEIPPPCDICGKMVTSRVHARHHKQIAHGIGFLVKACGVCGQLLHSLYKIGNHFKLAHPGVEMQMTPAKDNPFQVKCDLCIGIFSNAAHLKKHREDQHYQELGWKQPAKRKPANSNSKLYNERHGLPLLATGKALRTADGRVTCTSTNAKPPARPRGRPRTRSSAATEAATGEVAAVSPSSAIDNHNNSSSVSIHSDVVSEIVVPSVVVEPPRGEKVLCCFCLAIFFHPDVLLRHQREAHKEEMRIGAAAATAASAGSDDEDEGEDYEELELGVAVDHSSNDIINSSNKSKNKNQSKTRYGDGGASQAATTSEAKRKIVEETSSSEEEAEEEIDEDEYGNSSEYCDDEPDDD